MQLATLTDEQLRNARRAGFRRRKPKKGKLKTMRAVESYVDRWNDFVKGAKQKVQDHKRKEGDKDKLKRLKDSIRRHR